MNNPISGVEFGKERTVKDRRDRAEWERNQAARLRAEMRDRPASEVMVGQEHVAQAHEDTARAYEKRAREIEEGVEHLLQPTARFSQLVPGTTFRFPGTSVSHTKLAGSWYRDGATGGRFKTGAHTAVIELK